MLFRRPSDLPEGDRIAPMQASDLETVHRLECLCQQNPWSRRHFADELANPVATVDLYWRGTGLAGFLCCWLVAGELQVQNLATAPSLRREGIAARLMTHALYRSGRNGGLTAAWLEVRAGNTPAIALYERFGFTVSGVRKAYYPDGEDALVMTYDAEAGTDAGAYQERQPL